MRIVIQAIILAASAASAIATPVPQEVRALLGKRCDSKAYQDCVLVGNLRCASLSASGGNPGCYKLVCMYFHEERQVLIHYRLTLNSGFLPRGRRPGRLLDADTIMPYNGAGSSQ